MTKPVLLILFLLLILSILSVKKTGHFSGQFHAKAPRREGSPGGTALELFAPPPLAALRLCERYSLILSAINGRVGQALRGECLFSFDAGSAFAAVDF